jgi:hypothetical protein
MRIFDWRMLLLLLLLLNGRYVDAAAAVINTANVICRVKSQVYVHAERRTI